MAAVTWRELVFIFKETKFFVLWGEGVGADSNPTFQVREVVNNVGLRSRAQASPSAATASTSSTAAASTAPPAATPCCSSDIVSPLWTQDPELYYQGAPINLARLDSSGCSGTWSSCLRRRSRPAPNAQRPAAGLRHPARLVDGVRHRRLGARVVPPADRVELHFGYSSARSGSAHRDYGSTTDRGQRIASRWRSGWADYGSTQEQTIRETKVWGTGAVSVAFSINFERAPTPPIDCVR